MDSLSSSLSTVGNTTAARILNGMTMQQASVLAFERMFLTAGAAFLLVIPLALLLRKPKSAPNQSAKLEDLH